MTATCTPTTQKPLVSAMMQTPQGDCWMVPPPLSFQGRSESFEYSEFMRNHPHGSSCSDPDGLVNVLEQVSELTLGHPNQDFTVFPLHTPVRESGRNLRAVPCGSPPPLASVRPSSFVSRHKRRPSFDFTPEFNIGRRDAVLRPKRIRRSSITSKIHDAPRLPSSPDLSVAGEIHHEPCFSPVHQQSTVRVSVELSDDFPTSTHSSNMPMIGWSLTAPPPPMPMIGSPMMDQNRASTFSALKPPTSQVLKMRKNDSAWAAYHN